jgi:hypothetical protein
MTQPLTFYGLVNGHERSGQASERAFFFEQRAVADGVPGVHAHAMVIKMIVSLLLRTILVLPMMSDSFLLQILMFAASLALKVRSSVCSHFIDRVYIHVLSLCYIRTY